MGDNANTGVLQDAHGSRDGGAESQQMQITIDSQSFVNLGQLMGSRVSVSTTVGGPSSSVGGAGNNNPLGASFLSDGSQDSEGLRDFDQIFHPAGEGSTSSTWSGHGLGPHEEDAMDDADGDGDSEEEEDNDDDVDDEDDDSVLPALPPRSPAPASPTGSDLSSTPSNSGRSFKSTALAGFGDDLTTASSAGGSVVAIAGSIDDDFPDNQGEVIGALCLDEVAGDDVSCQRKTVTGIITPGKHYHDEGDPLKNNGSGASLVRNPPSSSSFSGEAEAQLGDAGSAASSPTSIHRDPWLHVPLEGSEGHADGSSNSSNIVDDSNQYNVPAEKANTKNEEEGSSNHQEHLIAAAAAGAWRTLAALGECGDCLACGMEKAVALATPPLQQLSRLVKLQVESGMEACARGQQAAIKAVDNVPQAPVRMWLSRIAGSLVFGAILGGTAAYYALPRFVMAKVSTCAGNGATSPWWNAPAGGYGESASGGAEQSFGERLNKALFAARAGESVAQQSLLEEVRNILAATGKSGGISAEQILRQFNAKRFAEASKAWSAAEGIAGSDPLDPLFFAPPSTPIYKSAPSSASQTHHHSDSYHKSTADCAAGGGSSGGGGGVFCPEDGVGPGSDGGGGDGGGSGASRSYYQARAGAGGGEAGTNAGRQSYRRPCGGGGWVC